MTTLICGALWGALCGIVISPAMDLTEVQTCLLALIGGFIIAAVIN